MNTDTEPDAASMAAYLANAAAIVHRTVAELLDNARTREAIGGRRAELLVRRNAALAVQIERWRDMERTAREREAVA